MQPHCFAGKKLHEFIGGLFLVDGPEVQLWMGLVVIVHAHVIHEVVVVIHLFRRCFAIVPKALSVKIQVDQEGKNVHLMQPLILPIGVPFVHPKRNRNAQKYDQKIQEIQKTQLVWIGRFVVCFHGDALSRENSPTHRRMTIDRFRTAYFASNQNWDARRYHLWVRCQNYWPLPCCASSHNSPF